MAEGTRQGRDDIKERMASASASSRFVFIAENSAGAFEVSGSGRYLDEWALEDGEWRIAARTVDYDLLRLRSAQ